MSRRQRQPNQVSTPSEATKTAVLEALDRAAEEYESTKLAFEIAAIEASVAEVRFEGFKQLNEAEVPLIKARELADDNPAPLR